MTTAAELASGKGHKDENFPVASILIKPEYRAPIMSFYRFARAADDIADHETAAPDEKFDRLEAMRASLVGESDAEPTGAALRGALHERGLDPCHALDLLEAFRRDVTKTRYTDWDDLIDYCRVSAMPVGRFMLDIHGEDRSLWPASDALCAALQIINHLQDCGKDYRAIDRVYIPQDVLSAAGAATADLGAAAATPQLRSVIVGLAEKTQELLAISAPFARGIRDGRLALEVAIIQRLAVSLCARLCRLDPLADRVHHGKVKSLLLAAGAALAHISRR